MSIRDHICGAHDVSLILIHFTGNAFYLLTCRICASLEVQCQSISRSSCKVGGKAWRLCACVAQLTCHVILFLASPLLDALYVGVWCHHQAGFCAQHMRYVMCALSIQKNANLIWDHWIYKPTLIISCLSIQYPQQAIKTKKNMVATGYLIDAFATT